MRKKRLLRLSKAKPGELPFSTATYYKWHHTGKFPGLFVKFAGGLFVDLDKQDEIVEKCRRK